MRKAEKQDQVAVDEQSDNVVQPVNAPSDLEKLTLVSLELLDIGAVYGERGVCYIQKNEMYQTINAKFNIEDKVIFAAGLAQDAASRCHRIIVAIRESDRKVLLSYLPDVATVTSLMPESIQTKIPAYTELGQNYLAMSTDFIASATEKARHLSGKLHTALDADEDGSVSYSDIKTSAGKIWSCARELDWDVVQEYKVSLFQLAIKMMQE